MAQLTVDERLAKVKTALGISGAYQDETLKFYIDDVISELIAAGVKKDVAFSAAAVGCIACGVKDLWNYTSGGVKHSEYFNRRMGQLSLKKSDESPSAETTEKHERITVEHLTNTVAFSLAYSDGALIRVFVNGMSVMSGKDYTTVANIITFTGNLIAGTEVDIFIYE